MGGDESDTPLPWVHPCILLVSLYYTNLNRKLNIRLIFISFFCDFISCIYCRCCRRGIREETAERGAGGERGLHEVPSLGRGLAQKGTVILSK